jgi:MFS family permease
VRLGVLESPLFAREAESRGVERVPLVEVVKRNPGEIILSALLRMSEQAPFYLFTAFILAYGTDTLGFSKGFVTNAVMVAAAVSLFSVPFFGRLSDRIGRSGCTWSAPLPRRSGAFRTSCCWTRSPAPSSSWRS